MLSFSFRGLSHIPDQLPRVCRALCSLGLCVYVFSFHSQSKAEASNAGSALEMGKPMSRQVKFCLPHCADGFARANPLQGTQAEQYSGAKPLPAVISTPELSGEETPSHHGEFFKHSPRTHRLSLAPPAPRARL